MTKSTDPNIEPETNILHHVAHYKPRRSWRTWLIGRPLPSADAPHETVGKAVGLAIFAVSSYQIAVSPAGLR